MPLGFGLPVEAFSEGRPPLPMDAAAGLVLILALLPAPAPRMRASVLRLGSDTSFDVATLILARSDTVDEYAASKPLVPLTLVPHLLLQSRLSSGLSYIAQISSCNEQSAVRQCVRIKSETEHNLYFCGILRGWKLLDSAEVRSCLSEV